jgi:hypothetical protein
MLSPPSSLRFCLSISHRILIGELQRDRVDTVALVSRSRETFAFEDVSKMAAAI